MINYKSKIKLIKTINSNLTVENNIVLLTKDNAKIVEDKIEEDIRNKKEHTKKIIEDCKSTKSIDDIIKDKDILLDVIKHIAKDNSTFTNLPNRFYRFDIIIEYMMDSNNEFFKRLKNGDINLPDEITCYSNEKSLASKICQELAEYLYGKDYYYKFDSVLCNMIPFYLDYYGVKHYFKDKLSEKVSYVCFHNILDDLKSKVGSDITRKELDHIIWHSYKNQIK